MAEKLERRPEITNRLRVIVKFHDDTRLPYEDGVEKEFEQLEIELWTTLAQKFPGLTLRRLFVSVKPEQLRAWVAAARENNPNRHIPNLLTFFAIDCPLQINPDLVAAELRLWPLVETAYAQRPASATSFDPTDDPRFPSQGYLTPSPDGIDATFVWGFANGLGAGQRIVDVEEGWTLGHEDLAGASITLIHGLNDRNLPCVSVTNKTRNVIPGFKRPHFPRRCSQKRPIGGDAVGTLHQVLNL